MPDYKNAKIYRLFHSDGRFYIGSTCSTLALRKSQHKHSQQVFKDTEWSEVKIILIKSFPCKTKEELYKKEHEIALPFLKDTKCLNKMSPQSTVETGVYDSSKKTPFELLEERVKELESIILSKPFNRNIIHALD
jgi:predicted GIY-YIG superfamily endonuclease